jgi:hypothetical protein
MEIQPLYANQPLVMGNITVAVKTADRERAEALVMRSSAVQAIRTQQGYEAARKAAGELRGMLDEIAGSKKNSNQPFKAVTQAINDLASEIGAPVEAEYRRITNLLSGYVATLEAAQKEVERVKAEALRIQQEQYEAKIREAQEAQKKAQDEAARLAAQVAEEQAKLAREMAAEAARIGDGSHRGLLPGGRVDHRWRFTLKDIRAVIESGNLNLLRWELDILACNDMVRTQLERDPEGTPDLPGIECKREINVHVRAAVQTKYK